MKNNFFSAPATLELCTKGLAILSLVTLSLLLAQNSLAANSINETPSRVKPSNTAKPRFSLSEANKLVQLPLACVEHQYPNKLQQTLASSEDLKSPKELHPIFYGCFDWHSAAHGYWSLVTLLKNFPELDKGEEIRALLVRNITAEKVAIELDYFEKKINKSFERTYGWAWLLKLSDTLSQWDDPLGQSLVKTLEPLSSDITSKYIAFLPKLVYPIRVGEHTNTAFGLSFAYDYAVNSKKQELQELIASRALNFFQDDTNCPIDWEPSGFDFLSPCFEEVDIMRRVLSTTEFPEWLDSFMPQLSKKDFDIPIAEVSDRSDGKLVHLDGLNFSRAWVFYGLAKQYPQYAHLTDLADLHMAASYPNLVGDSYEGGHWLGSFAINALVENIQE